MEIKRITYAYFSSPNAVDYNHGKGCWIVQHWFDEITATCWWTKIFQDNEKNAAFDCYDSLPGKEDKYSMKRSAITPS